MRVKVRHLRFKAGRFFFQPSKIMRAAGYYPEALGDDLKAAIARAEELNAAWDRDRTKPAPEMIQTGTVKWLAMHFERDLGYYLSKSPRYREQIDQFFRVINAMIGPHQISDIRRSHVRAIYNQLREAHSKPYADKAVKHLRRLFTFAIDEEIIETNPATSLNIPADPGRSQVWTRDQIDTMIRHADESGRRSVALAVSIAYDTTQRLGDILSAKRDQIDEGGLYVIQSKTGARVWNPLSQRTKDLIGNDLYLIVSEETGHPYNRTNFGRMFRKIATRAGIPVDLRFHDIRRTAATEAGNRGATEAEISAMTGHKPGSKILATYVKPGRDASRSAANKRNNPATKVGKPEEPEE